MSPNTISRPYKYLVGISIIQLLIVGILTVSPPLIQEDFSWHRSIIGVFYTIICILGIVAVFFPKKCAGLLFLKNIDVKNTGTFRKRDMTEDTSLIFGVRIVHGHHPSCESFSDHEIKIGNKTFCAGCLGFLFGALISLVIANLHFFFGWRIGKGGFIVVSIGILSVTFGLIQLLIIKIRGLLRIIPNAILVLGTVLILIGVDTLVNSVIVDEFILILSMFWVWTRISLSQWDHLKICTECGHKCLR